MVETQIGGKYHPQNVGLFDLKKSLLDQGVDVRHPISNEIKSTKAGVNYAFEPSERWPNFHAVEADYYSCLRDCDVHIVYNDFRWKSAEGYVGFSTTLEFCYCACLRRPVIFSSMPVFSDDIPIDILEMANSFLVQAAVVPFDTMTADFLSLAPMWSVAPKYQATAADVFRVMDRVKALLAEIEV